jgi:hypothetical protein
LDRLANEEPHLPEVKDQLAHLIIAFLTIVILSPTILTGALAGFVIGMVREVTEEGGPVSFKTVRAALGSWPDLAFWTLGGALAGILA